MHSLPVTVYYEDTDMGGIVYHANYLKYIERGRSAWVRAQGIDQNALRDDGIVFAVRHIEADFRAPARLDDLLTVRTRLIEMRGARFVMAQEVVGPEIMGYEMMGHEQGAVLFSAVVTLVAITLSGRPARLPKELRERLGGG